MEQCRIRRNTKWSATQQPSSYQRTVRLSRQSKRNDEFYWRFRPPLSTLSQWRTRYQDV